MSSAVGGNVYSVQYEALDAEANFLDPPSDGDVVEIPHLAYSILEINSAITVTLESVNSIPLGTMVLVISQASCTVESLALGDGDYILFIVTKNSSGNKVWTATAISTTSLTTDFLDDAEITFGTGLDAQIGWETGDASNHSLVIGLGDSNQSLHITDKGAIATDWNISADTHPTLYIHSNTTPATDYLKIGGHNGSSAVVADVVGGTSGILAVASSTVFTFDAGGINLDDDIGITFGSGNDTTLLFDGTDTILDAANGGTIDFQISSSEIASVQATGLACGTYVAASTAGTDQLTLQSTGTAPSGTGANVGHLYADFETDDDELFWLSGTVGTASQLTT